MSGLFANLARRREGSIAVEFALLIPALLAFLLVGAELGRAFYQANAVEKGVRAGALFAARAPQPLSAADRQTLENLVRTGDPTGAAAILASGWTLPGATLDIDTSGTFDAGTGPITVIQIQASVPFDPLMPGLMAFLGLGDHVMTSSHQQPYVGD